MPRKRSQGNEEDDREESTARDLAAGAEDRARSRAKKDDRRRSDEKEDDRPRSGKRNSDRARSGKGD